MTPLSSTLHVLPIHWDFVVTINTSWWSYSCNDICLYRRADTVHVCTRIVHFLLKAPNLVQRQCSMSRSKLDMAPTAKIMLSPVKAGLSKWHHLESGVKRLTDIQSAKFRTILDMAPSPK